MDTKSLKHVFSPQVPPVVALASHFLTCDNRRPGRGKHTKQMNLENRTKRKNQIENIPSSQNHSPEGSPEQGESATVLPPTSIAGSFQYSLASGGRAQAWSVFRIFLVVFVMDILQMCVYLVSKYIQSSSFVFFLQKILGEEFYLSIYEETVVDR